MRILVIEHDSSLVAALKKEFDAAKIAFDLAHGCEQIKALTASRSYDAAVVDVDAPNGDGVAAVRELRGSRPQLPIVAIGADGRGGQRAHAIDFGADEFLTKPAKSAELLARLRAATQLHARQAGPVLRLENLELSRDEHRVTRGGQKIRLTPKEFALLECLLTNAGQCVTRSEIVRHVWHHSDDPLTNIVDVYVNYLRKKVDVPFEPKLIHTVRGVGYQLKARGASGDKVA